MRPTILISALALTLSACALPIPQVTIPPKVAATLTQRERDAIAGNYAYVGEPITALNLTPAFQPSQIVSTQEVQSTDSTTEIDTYEQDTFALLSMQAQCTVIYWDTETDRVTLVNNYSATYDSRYSDHGC